MQTPAQSAVLAPVSPAVATAGRLPAGLRLRPGTAPAVVWQAWQVTARAKGFHVSRESITGAQREFLRNEVSQVRVFRKLEKAQAACAQANFTTAAERLSAEPLLGGAQ
jgi:hypothetical protein